MPRKNVLLTLQSTQTEDLRRTRLALEHAGLVIEKVLPITKVVTGRVRSDKMAKLLELDNVVSVREEGVVRLPPLHEDVPQ